MTLDPAVVFEPWLLGLCVDYSTSVPPLLSYFNVVLICLFYENRGIASELKSSRI